MESVGFPALQKKQNKMLRDNSGYHGAKTKRKLAGPLYSLLSQVDENEQLSNSYHVPGPVMGQVGDIKTNATSVVIPILQTRKLRFREGC